MKNLFIKIITLFFLGIFISSALVWAAETAGITVLVTLEYAEIIQATVEFRPNLVWPRLKYIRCYIELLGGYKVEEVDLATVTLTEVNGSVIEPLRTAGRPRIGDYDRDGIADLMVWFNIRSVIPLLKSGENSLTVTGKMIDGKGFRGTGIISFSERGISSSHRER